jgi:hypothetical protein
MEFEDFTEEMSLESKIELYSKIEAEIARRKYMLQLK